MRESTNLTTYLSVVIYVTVAIAAVSTADLSAPSDRQIRAVKIGGKSYKTWKEVQAKAKPLKDFYFVSPTKALKIVRTKGDILKSCTFVKPKKAEQDKVLNKVSVSEKAIDDFIALCDKAKQHPKGVKSVQKRFLDGIGIYSGTKWCGAGNIAANYNDLGEDAAADACCRDHDHCERYINAMTYNATYDLFNFAIWSKMHCDCDQTFFNCQKAANTQIGNEVGDIFFNSLAIGCFDQVVKYNEICVNSWFGVCVDYEEDLNDPYLEWVFVGNYLDY